METIKIPQVHMMMRQFKQVDNYLWYCRLLASYTTKPFFVYGMPAPSYVAKMFVARQKLDPLFGIPDVREMFRPIVNSTYFLTVQTTEKIEIQDVNPSKDIHTFNGTIKYKLNSIYNRLTEKLAEHRKLISDIRHIQKENVEWRTKMKHRQSKLSTFMQQHDIHMKDESKVPTKYKKKFQNLKMKHANAANRLVCEAERLREAIEWEKNTREVILEVIEYIKDLVLEKTKTSLAKGYADLVKAANEISDEDGYKYIIKQLWNISIDNIAEKLFEVCCSQYVTPIPEDFLSGTGLGELIPKAHLTNPEYLQIWMNKAFPRNYEEDTTALMLASEDEENKEDCFFDTTSGVKTVLKKNLPDGPIHAIIDIKQGYEVKVKLTLWNNRIGFGWTKKKSFFSSKLWGYFNLPQE